LPATQKASSAAVAECRNPQGENMMHAMAARAEKSIEKYSIIH